MITVKLQGGLGNQMFQYAAGRALSDKLKTKLLLDTRWFQTIKGPRAKRVYLLDKFNIQATVRKKSWLDLLKKEPVYEEPSKKFDSGFLALADKTVLDGYWQSEKYFPDITGQLRKELSLIGNFSDTTSKIMASAAGDNSVSLHIRRGDYASVEKINKVHGLLDKKYYENALKEILRKNPNPKLFVFSDDTAWVKANLSFPYQTEYVSELGLPEYEELFIMSACKYHIIANSSFSWWGAWLDPRPDKVVIAPKNWFADETKDSSDIVPKTWTRL